MGAVIRGHADGVGVRRDAAARRLLGELPRMPVLSSVMAARLAEVSERSGRTALRTLADHGILVPFPQSTQTADCYRWWYAPDVAALVSTN